MADEEAATGRLLDSGMRELLTDTLEVLRYVDKGYVQEGYGQLAHPDDDDLDLYVIGRLEGNALIAVQTHLRVSATCLRRLSLAAEFMLQVRIALSERESDHKPRLVN